MEKQENISKAKKRRKFLSKGEGYKQRRWDGMFVLGLGDRGAYHMGSKIAKKFNYFFPPFIRKTVYSFREERYKSQTSQVFRGGGSCFIVHLLERSISFNLSCGMRK